MINMSYLQSPTLFRFGKKCSQALLKRKEYSAGIIRSGKKHTKANEDGDSSSGFSSQSSQTPLYSGHVPTSLLQKGILFGGSALMGLYDPWRADMVAINGEVAGAPALTYIHSRMKASSEGRLILKDRPRITTQTVDYSALSALPPGTFGRVVADFNAQHKISPDSRSPVRFVDDADLAYVMTRYREVHDLLHALVGMPTDMVGEVAVKWIEALQFGIPMCAGGAILGPIRFSKPSQYKRYEVYRPWAIKVGTRAKFILNVYYEQRWEQDINDLRKEMRIDPVPQVVVK